MRLTVKAANAIEVKYLRARCGVRYWEDATVNGVEDTDGNVPCREGENWCPLINLETGKIENWTEGVTADIHYKVCDDGEYDLLDAEKNVVTSIDGYVPNMLSPEENGYGDYVIMHVGTDGVIQGFRADLKYFEGGDD